MENLTIAQMEFLIFNSQTSEMVLNIINNNKRTQAEIRKVLKNSTFKIVTSKKQ